MYQQMNDMNLKYLQCSMNVCDMPWVFVEYLNVWLVIISLEDKILLGKMGV